MNMDLEKILPHKKPMILIDDIIDFSREDESIKSVVTINENSMFYDDTIKGVSSCIGIEYMAQTIGCFAFLNDKLKEPKPGFLLGSRLYDMKTDKFLLNEKYYITAKRIFSEENIISFECKMHDEEKQEIATATLNVYQGSEMNI